MAKDREVLIKLRRKYSKDETISAMEKQMKVLEREKGELLAEIDFLKQEKEDLKKDFERRIISEIQEHHMWKHQKNLLKKRGEEITKLRLANRDLVSKYANVVLQLNNIQNKK